MLNDPDPEVRQIAEGIANICASFGPNTGYAPILQEAIDAAKAKNNE
jgi:hypothetical protein